MRVEEIVIPPIPSGPAKEQPRETRVCSIFLKQHNRIRFCKCVFELFNHHFLSVRIDEVFRRAREYELYIGILDPEPVRSVSISWPHLAVFSAFAVIAGITGFTSLLPYSVIWSVISGACAGLFLVLAVYHSHDRLVFFSQNGRVPLVVLFNRNPDRETFSTFIDKFTEHIRKAGDRCSLTGVNERLNAELLEHRRLMENNFISRKRYDIAKSRILERHR